VNEREVNGGRRTADGQNGASMLLTVKRITVSHQEPAVIQFPIFKK
jgi:hypothetical protein